ncbi:YczE/YyaS/YitT family protein [Dictyobacter aurantiacus]|uniref:Membrane protein YczE n=1 Tax=Dictyobacter aurantiacus TaxID=1936993 RepID=A0A401ZNX7_9CHLR|nr:hypothetical protein [Dictyobacter aurantiacus]GCE08579.1 hypothetical protein KDAU_59080 [Dictyobacter aurantiacus]
MYRFSWRTVFCWQYLVRFVVLVVGLFFYSTGIVFLYRSDFGLDPWDVFHQGISFHAPISFGTASIVVGAAIIILGLCLKVIPGVGTVLNMLLIGAFVDLNIWLGWLPDLGHASWMVRVAANVLGVAIIGMGTALYIAPRMGAGPRDGLMLRLQVLTKLRVSIVRTAIECTVLLIGFLLGGTVGLGTLIFALGIGPAFEMSQTLLKRLHISAWLEKLAAIPTTTETLRPADDSLLQPMPENVK